MRTEPNRAGKNQSDQTRLLNQAAYKIEKGDAASASQLLKELGLIDQDSNPSLPQLERIISDIVLSQCSPPSSDDRAETDSTSVSTQDTALALEQYSISRAYGEWIGQPFLGFLLETFGSEKVKEMVAAAFKHTTPEQGPDFSLLNNKVFTREYKESAVRGLQILLFAAKRNKPMAVSLEFRKKNKASRGNLAHAAAGMNTSMTFIAFSIEDGRQLGECAIPIRFQKIGDPITMPRELLLKGGRHLTCLTGDIIASTLEAIIKSNGNHSTRILPSKTLGLTGAWLKYQTRLRTGKQLSSATDQHGILHFMC